MKGFFKVLLHCWIKMFKVDEMHAMCTMSLKRSSLKATRHFCACGYNNKGVTWAELKEKLNLEDE